MVFLVHTSQNLRHCCVQSCPPEGPGPRTTRNKRDEPSRLPLCFRLSNRTTSMPAAAAAAAVSSGHGAILQTLFRCAPGKVDAGSVRCFLSPCARAPASSLSCSCTIYAGWPKDPRQGI